MNEKTIRQTFELMKKENEVVEIRMFTTKSNFSGYFKNADDVIKEIKRYNNATIFFSLNTVAESCFSREQSNVIIERPKITTSDRDIIGRDWVLIDIDPTRSTGVSATNKEKDGARLISNKVYKYLKNMGFAEPLCADSGNGYHLLYKVELANNDENRDLVKNFLLVLDMLFTNEYAEVDKSVFNAGRITKLYGTYSRKGTNTKSRPHRESKFIKIPDGEIKTTPKVLLQKVADSMPKPDKPSYKNDYGRKVFDIDEFISKNGISIQKIVQNNLGKKYVLNECVFDHNHKAPDACIFVLNNGALGYKCFHNSCSNYGWRDVRRHFEPNAYQERYRSTKPIGISRAQLVTPKEAKNKLGKKFLQMSEIGAVDRSKIVSIKTGFHEIDKKIIGCNKGELSVWSGKNSSGKSSVLNQMCLNACQEGFRVAIYSGELRKERMKQWTLLQAAGRQNTVATEHEKMFYTKGSVAKRIDKWLDGKFWVYNNDYGTKFQQILSDLKKHCEEEKLDMIVLDNLMALDITMLEGDKYTKQTTMILALTDFAKQNDIHIHMVCHPRKAITFLRKEDISGIADLTNAVDNVFIVHRVNRDFRREAAEFFGNITASQFEKYDNVIEVCKNRDLGVQDWLAGVYFEVESKRFLNEKHENICYGWDDTPISFMEINYDGELPFGNSDDLPY